MNRASAMLPAESLMPGTLSGTKHKERDFESDTAGEAANIHVVVRCRGRNEREIRENSAFVVDTEGAKGKHIELFLGSDMPRNKSYSFDRVFSHAAD